MLPVYPPSPCEILKKASLALWESDAAAAAAACAASCCAINSFNESIFVLRSGVKPYFSIADILALALGDKSNLVL